MNYAKKMLLVSEDYIDRLKKQSSASTDDTVASPANNGETNDDQTIAQTLPKTLRDKAEALIKYLRANGIAYDEKHRLVIDGKPVDGANYADIINDLVRYRESLPPPHGFNLIAPHLKRLNISRELVTNMQRYNAIMGLETATPTQMPRLSSPASSQGTQPYTDDTADPVNAPSRPKSGGRKRAASREARDVNTMPKRRNTKWITW